MNSFNVLLIGLDIVLIGLAGYYLFWQSIVQPVVLPGGRSREAVY